jgi:two-component system CheB/CheR fusion protein
MTDPAESTISLAGLRVLLVEDGDDERAMYSAALEEYGAIPRVVNSGNGALEALGSERFDVLVSDIALPEMSGYDLIAKVRALSPSSNGGIPAIAVTALAHDNGAAHAHAAGFDRFCTKPCAPADLAAVIFDLVVARRASNAR